MIQMHETKKFPVPESEDSEEKGRGFLIHPVPAPNSRVQVFRKGKQLEVPLPTVIIDTREPPGHAYDFRRFPKWVGETLRKTLKTGDYSIQGLEDEICVERKTMEDLVSTLTANRKTFIKECQRMEALRRKVIVIESTLARLKSRYLHSDAHPNSIFGTLVAIQERFDVHIMFAATRELAEEYTVSTLVKYHALHWLEEQGHGRYFIEGDI